MILRDKFLAFLVHFIFSAILVLLLGFVVFKIWYMAPFYQLFNVGKIFWLIVLVDLIIGPLLTFIVFNRSKKTLKLDLFVIGTVQLMAFLFGTWSIAQARPSWLVLADTSFYAISPSMTKNADGESVSLPFYEQNWGKPALKMIDTLRENDTKVSTLQQPTKYLSLSDNIIRHNKQPIIQLKLEQPELYEQMVNKYPTMDGYIPIILEATLEVPFVIVDSNGKVLGIEYFPPRQSTHRS